jgi:signal transduction histidine kinase
MQLTNRHHRVAFDRPFLLHVALFAVYSLSSVQMQSRLNQLWRKMTLARQFAVAAIVVLLPATATLGWLMSDIISKTLVNNTASTIVIYMDGLVAPLVKEISNQGNLSPASYEKLDKLLADARSDSSIISMKIWKRDGTIIYSSFHDMIGKKFPPSDTFSEALSGKLGAELNGEFDEEEVHEKTSGKILLAVYAPVREPTSREIIAVSEFYLNGDDLNREVSQAWLNSWLIVIASTGLTVLLLSLFVSRGSRTILRQQDKLADKVVELEESLHANETLRSKLREANLNVSSVNEKVLQHVGTDLHDGPAQMLAYATLRLPSFQELTKPGSKVKSEIDNLRRILSDALKDIRRVSSGLMLPELEVSTLQQSVALAIGNHINNTNSEVVQVFEGSPCDVPSALKICAYRFVQEALNNAFKHASGMGQKVILLCDKEVIIEVHDSGPGLKLTKSNMRRLGLSGMFARVEALGGNLTIETPARGGTILRASFPVIANLGAAAHARKN